MASTAFEDWLPEGWTQYGDANPIPSPPPYEQSFVTRLESHHTFHEHATREGHQLDASSSLSQHDWNLTIRAKFLSGRDLDPYSIQNLPAHLLPFFAYKDAAIYVPTSGGYVNTSSLFDAMYREWYPTRDRSVFQHGIDNICGAPFFSSTFRVDFGVSPPQSTAQLSLIIHWHLALSRRLHELLPRFRYLKEVGKMMVRAGLTPEELQAVPEARAHREYTPLMRRTFSECFLWVERGWEDYGVRLVLLDEDMLRRVSSAKCERLTRDVDMEKQVKEAMSISDMREEAEPDEHAGISLETVMDHVSIWRGKLQDIMRAVLGAEEVRKTGVRDFNYVRHEWMGEGVNVGIDGEPLCAEK